MRFDQVLWETQTPHIIRKYIMHDFWMRNKKWDHYFNPLYSLVFISQLEKCSSAPPNCSHAQNIVFDICSRRSSMRWTYTVIIHGAIQLTVLVIHLNEKIQLTLQSSTSSMANTASLSSHSRTTTTATPLLQSNSSVIRRWTTCSTPPRPSTSYAPTTLIACRAKSWLSQLAPLLRLAPSLLRRPRRLQAGPAQGICTSQAVSYLLLWPYIFSWCSCSTGVNWQGLLYLCE